MVMKFTNLRSEFEECFGPMKDMTERQMWFLIKFAKHVRGRCRNNAALRNYLKSEFPVFSFSVVFARNDNGEEYKTMKVSKNEKDNRRTEEKTT